jgi:hypothetical protein
VRAKIAGSPPDFQGDYNKQVVQNLEMALQQVGYEPVPEGGLILLVRAQVSDSGQKVSVHPIGVPPPSRRPAASNRETAGSPAPSFQRGQEYPVPELTGGLLLTNDKGTALWQNETHFSGRMVLFQTDNPPREMQQRMWRAFDTRTRTAAVAAWKQ